jgi:hypothetical protein
MKWRLRVVVLSVCLGSIGLHAAELINQPAEPNNQPADLNEQVPLQDLNRPADLTDQPNEIGARIAAGVIETDNVTRTATATMSDTIEALSGDVAMHEQTRRFDTDVLSNLEYLSYAHHTYSNEVVGNFIGTGTFAIVPKEFEWVLEDNFGQQELDPTTTITPTNLENINYVSTGPNLLMAISPLTHAQVSVRLSNVYYQTSDLNNNRGDASLALIRALSAASNISLNVAAERVLYQDDIDNPDYTTKEAYLRYDAQGARTKLAVDLGYDDVGGLSSTGAGALVHFDAARVLSPSSHLDLSFGQDISDNSNLLRQLQSQTGLAVNATYLQRANDPFVNRYARLAWQFEHNRTSINFDVARYEERHLQDFGLNQNRTQTDFGVRRTLAPAWTAAIGASYSKGDYTDAAANYSEVIASASLDWRIGRHLDLRAEYDRFVQHSDELANQFTENRIGLTLGWQVNSSRSPMMPGRNGTTLQGL